MHSGFSKLDLLAVIGVCVLLLSLLFPAMNNRRVPSQRAACIVNQSNIALALLNYESARGSFPGWRTLHRDTETEISWMREVFPYLWIGGNFDTLEDQREAFELDFETSPIWLCPVSPVKPPDRQFSYIANCGKMDATFSAVGPENPGGHLPDDDKENGVFFDRVATDTGVSIDFISGKKGTSYTIMLSESLQAGCWNEKPRENLLGFCYPDPSFLNQKRDLCSGPDAPVVPVFPNQCLKGDPAIEHGRVEGLGEYRFARPSSNHPGVVVAAFCDRSVRMINTGIDPELFQLLMRTQVERADLGKLAGFE